MSIQTKSIEYKHGEVDLEGYLAWDATGTDKKPGVLVSHAWRGRSDFENHKAEQLAELGYVGFALDLFGKGVLGNSVEENSGLIQPFLDDRVMLQSRLSLAVDVLKKQSEVDQSRIAAMGYCFGGLCVLDLARIGTNLAGVASFHGLFGAPGNTEDKQISARVIALHGWDDPMATPEQVVAFGEEMTAMGADWQLHAYGNTLHAFTNPEANDPGHGTVYNENAERRSWQSLQLFLAEVF